MRTIRRYPNRKLYDTTVSHYVNLSQIAAYIRAGEEVRVVEYRTERDLTSATMAEIIFEEEKRSPRLDLGGLHGIVRSGRIR